jgi:hypothetical protein
MTADEKIGAFNAASPTVGLSMAGKLGKARIAVKLTSIRPASASTQDGWEAQISQRVEVYEVVGFFSSWRHFLPILRTTVV